jgi:hypothetical protein
VASAVKLELLEARYGWSSTIIASQLSVNKWHASNAEPTFADAIMDRLTCSADRIEPKVASKRQKRKK